MLKSLMDQPFASTSIFHFTKSPVFVTIPSPIKVFLIDGVHVIASSHSSVFPITKHATFLIFWFDSGIFTTFVVSSITIFSHSFNVPSTFQVIVFVVVPVGVFTVTPVGLLVTT